LETARTGERISTLDLYERDPVLLAGPSGAAWYEAGLRAAERTGVPLRCFRIGADLVVEDFPAGKPGGPPAGKQPGKPSGKPSGTGRPLGGSDGPDGPVGPPSRARAAAKDGPPDFGRAHGVGDDGAVLVRPDGFVAWRAEGADPDPGGTLERVLREVFRLP